MLIFAPSRCFIAAGAGEGGEVNPHWGAQRVEATDAIGLGHLRF